MLLRIWLKSAEEGGLPPVVRGCAAIVVQDRTAYDTGARIYPCLRHPVRQCCDMFGSISVISVGGGRIRRLSKNWGLKKIWDGTFYKGGGQDLIAKVGVFCKG
jgi:hypothetical protein